MATTNVLPTFLPPAPQTIFYDDHAFARKTIRVVSKETRLAFSDYGGMHVERHKTTRFRGWIPAFASDPVKLKKVLIVSAWRFLHGGKKVPDNIQLDELIRLTDEKFARDEKRISSLDPANYSSLQQEIFDRYRVSYDQGYMKVRAAVMYRSWNLGWHSTRVAASLQMSPQQIRIILWRMNQIARELGYETFPAGRRGRRTWAESKVMLHRGAKVRALGHKTNMTDEEKRAWHRSYSKIWYATKKKLQSSLQQ
jgi:hypothetical protein